MDTNGVVLNQLYLFLKQAYIGYLLLIPLIFMVLDVISGIVSAYRRGIFTFKRLMDFVKNDLVIYIGVVSGSCVTFYMTQSSVGTSAAMTLLILGHCTKLVASIYSNCQEFLTADQLQAVEDLGQSLGIPPPPPLTPPPSPSPLLTSPTVVQQGIEPVRQNIAMMQTQAALPVVTPSVPQGNSAPSFPSGI